MTRVFKGEGWPRANTKAKACSRTSRRVGEKIIINGGGVDNADEDDDDKYFGDEFCQCH